MQLKQDVSAASALASLLRGLPLPSCEEWELLARESSSGPHDGWLLPAALGRGRLVPGEGEEAQPVLEQGCFSWPEKVAV